MGGGMGVIATDALRSRGLQMARFSSGTMDRLNSILSNRWSHGNPVDPAGDPIVYPLIWPVMEDENVDAVMVVGGIGLVGGLITLLAVHPSRKDECARQIQSLEQEEIDNLDRLMECREKQRKPVVIVRTVSEHRTEDTRRVAERMRRNHLVPFPSAERAAGALARLVEYSEYLGIAGGSI
jgi:acyl-CoA synthetase (NDP forming)